MVRRLPLIGCLALAACGGSAAVAPTSTTPPTITEPATTAVDAAPASSTVAPTTSQAPALVADWRIDRGVVAGEAVTLHDDSAGEIESARWDLGDGRSSTDRDPTVVWTAPGSYTVTLTVTDGERSSTFSRVIDVSAVATATPVHANGATTSTTPTTTTAPPATSAAPTGAVTGTVQLQTGNCMPTIVADGEDPPECQTSPAAVRIEIFSAVPITESLKGQTVVGAVTSASDGSYRITLPPGTWTFAPVSPDPGFPGCSTSDGIHHCPVVVAADTTTRHDIVVINAVF